MINDITFVVKITDQLLVLPSAGSEKTVFSPRLRNVVLTVTKVDDKWLVDKFTDPSKTTALNTSTTKYSGFGQ
ncbi:MAG: hypothetical protein UU93_C0033G0008 [Candidatus Amesbacteria bacterium GW2011_GWA2_42_12]|uniref:Uncharacterized protein n=1 Tax=Candidatus Amesbacteria bacterium GW2011_GWA2_42_12 TaxID=1618356 RepID=A0A0G0Y1J1_9BACT|nr:MAG: hypothetical protein UU93_C0033G0008 [Candidatus Amesbacteria bacterium GW2011_GWA2_42_12]